MKCHHIGIATKSIEKSCNLYRLLGFIPETTNAIYDSLRNINILFIVNGTTRLELIERANEDATSPIDAYIQSSSFETYYHTCYCTNSLADSIDELKKNNFFVISPPMPAVAINNCPVCFMYHKTLGIIELVEKGE